MIVITTPTGQIGHQVLGNLLDSGEALRVIDRDPSRIPAGLRQHIEVIEGSHGDPDVVDEAFAGADAVFWLVPPIRGPGASKRPMPASPGRRPRRSGATR